MGKRKVGQVTRVQPSRSRGVPVRFGLEGVESSTEADKPKAEPPKRTKLFDTTAELRPIADKLTNTIDAIAKARGAGFVDKDPSAPALGHGPHAGAGARYTDEDGRPYLIGEMAWLAMSEQTPDGAARRAAAAAAAAAATAGSATVATRAPRGPDRRRDGEIYYGMIKIYRMGIDAAEGAGRQCPIVIGQEFFNPLLLLEWKLIASLSELPEHLRRPDVWLAGKGLFITASAASLDGHVEVEWPDEDVRGHEGAPIGGAFTLNAERTLHEVHERNRGAHFEPLREHDVATMLQLRPPARCPFDEAAPFAPTLLGVAGYAPACGALLTGASARDGWARVAIFDDGRVLALEPGQVGELPLQGRRARLPAPDIHPDLAAELQLPPEARAWHVEHSLPWLVTHGDLVLLDTVESAEVNSCVAKGVAANEYILPWLAGSGYALFGTKLARVDGTMRPWGSMVLPNILKSVTKLFSMETPCDEGAFSRPAYVAFKSKCEAKGSGLNPAALEFDMEPRILSTSLCCFGQMERCGVHQYTFAWRELPVAVQHELLERLLTTRRVAVTQARGTNYFVAMASSRKNASYLTYDLITHKLTLYIPIRMFGSGQPRGAPITPSLDKTKGTDQRFSLVSLSWVTGRNGHDPADATRKAFQPPWAVRPLS